MTALTDVRVSQMTLGSSFSVVVKSQSEISSWQNSLRIWKCHWNGLKQLVCHMSKTFSPEMRESLP